MGEPRSWSIWEVVQASRVRAEESGLRVIDLGQGTPTDPTPIPVQEALAGSADAPGYPPAHGTVALREAYSDWLHRSTGAALDPEDVIATVGSKECIATLPWLLGLGPGDTVVVPELAYPTYAAGADAAGCQVIATDATVAIGPRRVSVLWLNTPGNPTGRVLPEQHLAKVVDWARSRGTLVISDECYRELTGPGVDAPSILSPRVARGSYEGILAVHSLSKRSSMAGYRCGFLAGDPAVVSRLLRRRRDMGLIVPTPIQAAGVAALADDAGVEAARNRYAARRALLAAAVTATGFRVDDSEAGLFLWITRDEPDSVTVEWFADRGVLVAPGSFYGATGERHVRLSVTATDADLAEVARRLGA
ncbi:MAG: succinyldiaminopimelate transaminase [Candidatus Nanopelagicales bacterium]